MVDWKSPEIEFLCSALYMKMVIFLLGAYSWYILESWHIVEGALVTRRIKFARIHIPYLTARYCQLTTLVLLCIVTQIPTSVVTSCQIIGTSHATLVIGDIAFVAASANLFVRAYTICKDSVIVRVALILGLLGHIGYAVLMGVVTVRGVWSADHTECAIDSGSTEHIVIGFFVYSMTWDTMILSCTILGLRRAQINTLSSNNALLNALKAQGVGYAVITSLTSIPVTVSLVLNLNASMNIFFSTPGITISVITSSKMVVSLLKLKDGESEGEQAGSNSHSLPVNTNLFTTNIRLTDFDPNSAGIELVSRGEKYVEQVQPPPERHTIELNMGSTNNV